MYVHPGVNQVLGDVCPLGAADTEVAVRVVRVVRRARRTAGERVAEPNETTGFSCDWVDPGETLTTASPWAVRVREKIVHRNHARKQPSPRTRMEPDVRIAFVRAQGIGRERVDADGFTLNGPARSAGSVAVGIGGCIFTIRFQAGASATAIAQRIARRVLGHYLPEITAESCDRCTVRLRSHT